jgi:prostaglandin-E synthase
VYLTIELLDDKDVKLKMKPDGHFYFSAKGSDEMQYELDLDLFAAVNVEVRVLTTNAILSVRFRTC